MKKLFLTLVLAIATVAASAQVYVGGEVGLWRNSDANHTNFTLQPEVGYTLSKQWAIGTKIGFQHNYNSGSKVNAINVSPYARYTFAKFGPVNLFADGGFGFYSVKPKNGSSVSAWEVGVKPGLAVNLNKKLSFVAHVGFLGYRDSDDAIAGKLWENGFGFNLSGNSLQFGLNYNF